MFSAFKNFPKIPHGGPILLIAAIIFSGLLFARSLAFLPGFAGLSLYAFWPKFFSQDRFRPGMFFIAALTVTLCAATSALWSSDPFYVLERSGKIALVLIPGALWAGAMASLPESVSKKILQVLTALVMVITALFINDLVFDYPFMRLMHTLSGNDGVFNDYDINRNIVALVFAFLPVLAFVYQARFLKTGSTPQALGTSIALAAFLLPVLLMTQSQSAQMALIAGVFFMLFFPVKCRMAWLGLKAVFFIGILTAPFVAIALFNMVPHAAMADNLQASWLSSANVLPRLELWDFVSRYILDHFWIGSGVEATRLVEAFDNKEMYQPGLTLLHPHNAVLQIWMEFGLLGAVFASAASLWLLSQIARQPDVLSRRLWLGLLMACCAVGIVGYGLWQGWWLGLIIFTSGLCALAQRRPTSAANQI